jgi:hypothetical protein
VARKFKSLLNLLTLNEDPVSGDAGDVYFNVISKNIKIHNGLSWVDLTPGSTDPTPFYMHTHTYDGDVHTVDIQETINFTNDINDVASVNETIPAIIGLDGGEPNSTYNNVSVTNVTLLDGGEVGN